jgi:hypothetical protein
MQQEIKKVFISSTLFDLELYRKYAIEAVNQLGFEPILFETTQPGLSQTDISEIIRSELMKADIFILIIGHKYGSIVQKSGKSLIEIEYEKSKELGKPTLVFLARDDVPWPPESIDIDRSQVMDFRDRIIRNFRYQKFSSPDELSSKIIESLIHLKERTIEEISVETVQEDLVKNVKIIKLLLSSPSDVSEERENVSNAVFRYNQEFLEHRGIFIKLIKWEDMAPQIGPGAQNVINNQIGNYHIFVGLMWNRFGTPTDVAASGTKEEFDSAVSLWEKNRKPWIVFYFCERPSNFTKPEQLEQKKLVLDFKFNLFEKGVVRNYNSIDDFENVLYKDLVKITATPEFLESIS